MSAVQAWFPPLAYLVSSALFIFGLKRLSKVRTARVGNQISALAMLIAVIGTLVEIGIVGYQWIIIGLLVGALVGAVAAVRVEMTAMPEMVAIFNGFGGAASALVAVAYFWAKVLEAPGLRRRPERGRADGRRAGGDERALGHRRRHHLHRQHHRVHEAERLAPAGRADPPARTTRHQRRARAGVPRRHGDLHRLRLRRE